MPTRYTKEFANAPGTSPGDELVRANWIVVKRVLLCCTVRVGAGLGRKKENVRKKK